MLELSLVVLVAQTRYDDYFILLYLTFVLLTFDALGGSGVNW
jgi:hypothetical protein